MNRKPNLFEKIGNFVTGKGFYFVILICVAAIALSGFYLYRSVSGALEGPEDEPVSGSASLAPVSPQPTVSAVPKVTAQPNPSPSPSPKPVVTPTPSPTVSAKPTPAPSPSPSPSPAALVFTWPINGSVISPHSVEALAYDPTMGDWRTHAGVDIAASIGTEVKATAAGTVISIYEDDLYGTTVVIDHGKDLTSVYSNLAAVPTVKTGAKVSTGTVIGTVGNTAPAESKLNPHLHFAMFHYDVAVDPLDYLPER